MPKGKPYTPARVEEELRRFTADRDTWPTWSEFERAGLKGLRNAVDRFGGARKWSTKLRKRYEPRAGRPPWTEQRISDELEGLAGTLDRWPTQAEWTAMGRGPLLDAMRSHGGIRGWARLYGFSAGRQRWDDTLIEDELRAFLAGRRGWPAKREFAAAGKTALLATVYAHTPYEQPDGQRAWV